MTATITPTRTLTDGEVSEIRSRYRAGETQADLAREYGVTASVLNKRVRDLRPIRQTSLDPFVFLRQPDGWRRLAACRGDLKFTDRPVRDQIAVCRTCPVTADCALLGIVGPVVPGDEVVYGGLTPTQRLQLRQRSMRGSS